MMPMLPSWTLSKFLQKEAISFLRFWIENTCLAIHVSLGTNYFHCSIAVVASFSQRCLSVTGGGATIVAVVI